MEKEQKLQQLYIECVNELKTIGIPTENKTIEIQLSKRNNKRYGCCKPELPDTQYRKITTSRFKIYCKISKLSKIYN